MWASGDDRGRNTTNDHRKHPKVSYPIGSTTNRQLPALEQVGHLGAEEQYGPALNKWSNAYTCFSLLLDSIIDEMFSTSLLPFTERVHRANRSFINSNAADMKLFPIDSQ
jgi:hypothetical protein